MISPEGVNNTMEWEHLFQCCMLERGLDYYLDDRVSDLHISDKKIEAVVEGSEDYRVKILIDDDEITDMSCSCPYASDGAPCKHMAAVLYEYLEKYTKESEQSASYVSNRQHYRELADILLEIRQLPGGQQRSSEIEQHWREIYRNRRAMMDELNQMHRRKLKL